MYTLDTIHAHIKPYLPGNLAIAFTVLEPDRVVATMPCAKTCAPPATSCMAGPTWPLPTPWARWER